MPTAQGSSRRSPSNRRKEDPDGGATVTTGVRAAAAAIATEDLPPARALQRILRLLVDEGPAARASAWVPAGAGAVCAGSIGDGDDEGAATRMLREGGQVPIAVDGFIGILLARGGETVGTLVAAADVGQEEVCRRVLGDVADSVTTVLERERVPAAQHEPGLAAANERLLVRLGFDLHDGPLQQVYVLAQDVRLLRDQLVALLEGEHRDPVVGRFADLESQLAELHQDLRDLAHSLEPRALLQQPLPDAVERELTALHRRTGIATSIELDGSFDALSASQRIALLRVLQEALSNIRQHSGAGRVAVRLSDAAGGVGMEIEDDGHGFDPAAVVPDEEGQSGIGLVGMRERLRLLGGSLEIESAAGGPTTLTATLPRWVPVASAGG
jgi:signal transduction histidine kinase